MGASQLPFSTLWLRQFPSMPRTVPSTGCSGWPHKECSPSLPSRFHWFLQHHQCVEHNGYWIPNYGERYRNGEAIATGFVESTVNQVVSKRFCKKQQMRWSKRGAHLLLQTRVKTPIGNWAQYSSAGTLTCRWKSGLKWHNPQLLHALLNLLGRVAGDRLDDSTSGILAQY